MKYFTFYRESNNFNDILSDKILKKYIDEVITWQRYCRIGIQDMFVTKVNIHITLKYGDELRTNFIKDYKPIPYKDYTPSTERE